MPWPPPGHGVAGALHWCKGPGGLEGWRDARLCWENGEGRGWDWGGGECGCSMLSSPSRARMAGLHRLLPERGRVTCPLLGQLSLYVRLNFQERDGECQSADDLQYQVELTRPCFWSLLPCFVGCELLSILLFLFVLRTGF